MRRRQRLITHEGRVPVLRQRKEVRLMQAKELDKLNGTEANSLLAERLRNFARGGLAPELVLRFAVRPEIHVPAEAPESAPETANGRRVVA